MNFFYQPLTTVALLESGTAAQAVNGGNSQDGVILSQTFGESLGTLFTDTSFTTPGGTVHSITIRTGDNVNGIGIDTTNHGNEWISQFHGGNIGTPRTLSLNAGERFQCLEAHWDPSIKYTKITTTSGGVLQGGTRMAKTGKICAPNGYQLGGFVGYAGMELNEVGVIWIKNNFA